MKEDVLTFVEDVLETAGFDLRATVETTGEAPDDLRVVLSGEDRSLLLGRGAELLDAIEYLTNRAFSRQIDHDARIVFDSGSYRALREQELRLMAESAADRVRRSREPFLFEAMSPSERRIVHLALVESAWVRTESVGNGFDRKVKVLPKT